MYKLNTILGTFYPLSDEHMSTIILRYLKRVFERWHIQGVTTCWKSVHRYQGYQPNIGGITNVYQEEIDQIKYLTDISRIFKNIYWIYLNICQISQNSGHKVFFVFSLKKLVKSLKTAPCFDRIQQPNIKDINRISAGYQGVFHTGYHELSPLGHIRPSMFHIGLILRYIC